MARPYTLTPLKVGCEVVGINLSEAVNKNTIKLIKEDVREHRVLVFRNQSGLSPGRHVEIGKWFGEIESTFYKHPKSPHSDIFRVSNDCNEGCTNVGRTGWHIDGSFQDAPFSHSLYHIIAVPRQSNTSFLPLTELINSLPEERRQLWERLWMVSDKRQGPVHPLIYKHPETGQPVLCFHLGMTEGFLLDYGSSEQKLCDPQTSNNILKQIKEEVLKNVDLIYQHVYKEGDLVISDNLAVGHEASPDTQLSRDKIGLRVMHRVTIKGKSCPSK